MNRIFTLLFMIIFQVAYAQPDNHYIDIWQEGGSILYQNNTNYKHTTQVEYSSYTKTGYYIDSFSISKSLPPFHADYIAMESTNTTYDLRYIRLYTNDFEYIDIWEENGSILYQTSLNCNITVNIEYSMFTETYKFIDYISLSKVLPHSHADYIAKSGSKTKYKIKYIKFFIN